MKNHITYCVPRGSDQDFLIEATDDAGAAIDLNAFDKIFVMLYYADRSILKKYSVIYQPGFEPLTIGGASNNELSFRLYSDDTTLAKQAIVYCEIITKVADAEPGSGHDDKYITIVTEQYLCTIINSITRTLTLP